MLVDAETLQPARDGFSRAFGEATERIKPELFESFVELTTPVVETPEEVEFELRALRQEAAERAAAHGLALLATGSHPDRPWARSDRPARALPAVEGDAAAAPSAAGLWAPRARVRARSRHVPPGLRGRTSRGCRSCSPPPRTRRTGRERTAAGARSAPGSCSRCRPAAPRRCCAAGTTGRPRPAATAGAATGTPGRGRSTGRSRCASSTSPPRCAGRPSLPAEVQRLVREAAETDAEPYDREEYAARRDAAGREGGGPEAERQLELGPEAAVQELVALTLG